ncbi:MAG: hypothetical protein Q9219_003630 [cf. Caloplaca sp. 3 TL-2023]
MSAVSSAINQCKWLWYRQATSRRVLDLQLFDDASRGPWGAQVVLYQARSVPSNNTPTIARSQAYAARSEEGLPLPSLVDLSLKAAVYNGIFDIKRNADGGLNYTCSTGHCSWQDFSSLAVCSRCVNVTSYLERQYTDGKCHWLGLPGGPALSGSGGQINASVTNISSELHGIEPSVVRFSSLVSKTANDFDQVQAVECSLFYCVGKYDATVTDGIMSQRMLDSWYNNSARIGSSSDLILRPPAEFANRSGNPIEFEVSHTAAAAINGFMSNIFTGSGNANNSGAIFSSDIMQALYDTSNLTERIDNLVSSMTNNIRGQDDNISSPAYGIAWTSETFVHVRWAWFAFPAALILVAAFFLLSIILETSYRDILVWKSSNLALIFHGRGLDLSNPSEVPVNTLSEMNTRARNIKAELLETPQGGWKLTQEGQ